jgi:putative addiction module component (TIGR02574 family)
MQTSSGLGDDNMSTSLHELEAHVLSLSAEDRARLLERLIESFEPDSDSGKAWIAEALRREADVKAGASSMVSGPEALQRIRARLG